MDAHFRLLKISVQIVQLWPYHARPTAQPRHEDVSAETPGTYKEKTIEDGTPVGGIVRMTQSMPIRKADLRPAWHACP